jgi:hypothetical protein
MLWYADASQRAAMRLRKRHKRTGAGIVFGRVRDSGSGMNNTGSHRLAAV